MAAIMRDPKHSQYDMDLSDLLVQVERDIAHAHRRMEHAGASAYVDDRSVPNMVATGLGLRDLAEGGDSPRFRDLAASTEWDGYCGDVAEGYELIGEWAAAEHFLVLALAAHMEKPMYSVAGAEADRAKLRERLVGAMARQ